MALSKNGYPVEIIAFVFGFFQMPYSKFLGLLCLVMSECKMSITDIRQLLSPNIVYMIYIIIFIIILA